MPLRFFSSFMLRRFLRTLQPYQSASIPLIRVGREMDGGYVMGDCLKNVDAAYSFGIGDDVSWDKGIATRGIPVFMYDHTVDEIPDHHDNFHIHKMGVCGIPHKPNMKDIGTLMRENGHLGKDLLVKMDIEGAEYKVLDALTDEDLSHFSQLVIEFHSFDRLFREFRFLWFLLGLILWRSRKVHSSLEKILRHMHCVHIHGNNYQGMVTKGGITLPRVVEFTFIRKDMADDFMPSDTLRPDLDFPNSGKFPDLDVSNLWRQ